MFRVEIEALVLVVVAVVAFLLYRGLIRSRWFSRLVGGTKPLPESSEEVLGQLDKAESLARKRANEARRDAVENIQTAKKIRRRVKPS